MLPILYSDLPYFLYNISGVNRLNTLMGWGGVVILYIYIYPCNTFPDLDCTSVGSVGFIFLTNCHFTKCTFALDLEFLILNSKYQGWGSISFILRIYKFWSIRIHLITNLISINLLKRLEKKIFSYLYLNLLDKLLF